MSKLEVIRQWVDGLLANLPEAEDRRYGHVHLYGVAQACSLLAIKRGLDPELATAAGMLHDLYAYATGVRKFHSHNGAEQVRPWLRKNSLYTPQEQLLIRSAIFHHGDKGHVHDPYDELLKDADALQHYFFDPSVPVTEKDAPRLTDILWELGLNAAFQQFVRPPIDKREVCEDKKSRLAEVARTLAGQDILGDRGDETYMELIRYWPEPEAFDELKDGWCAAFVFHACVLADIHLPIRHPKVSCRFAGVAAWYEWGKLMGFYIPEGADVLSQIGDILLYNDVISPERKEANGLRRDHIGIVVSIGHDKLTVAEGNVDNRNRSGLVTRPLHTHVDGYIRIPDDYRYDGWKVDYKTGAVRVVPYVPRR